MKKKESIFLLFTSFLFILTLTACGNDTSKEDNEKKKIKASITITEDNGKKQLSKKSISTEAGTNLYTIMKNYYNIKEQKGFITAINGMSQNKKMGKYWLFEVNGEPATTGAQEIELKDGDKITWDLHEAH